MLQTDIADHNHLCPAGQTRNQMYSRFGKLQGVRPGAQELLVGCSIHGAAASRNAYQISVDTHKLSVRSSGRNLQPDAAPPATS